MRISCIVPTYNSAFYLRMGLESLTLQQLVDNVELEVIVVDDGSTDNTAAVVDAVRSANVRISYVHRPRDAYANRSRTRNLGIAKASGDVLCFLDAGVIVPPSFFQRVADRLGNEPNMVLAHETYGLYIDPEEEDMSILDDFAVERLDECMPRIQQLQSWTDPRSLSAPYIHYNLSLLPAPWTDGWSCALSVPAQLVDTAGGFDERFYGWGVEDCEFAYRLYRAGAQFRFERQAYAFHYPHPISRSAAKEQSLRDNSIQMHHMHYELDTECYVHYLGLHYQGFLEKLRTLDLSALLPAELPQQWLRDESQPTPSGRVLAIGIDRPDWIRSLGATHVFAHNEQVSSLLREQLPESDIRCLIGVDTPYEEGCFERIYISDYVRTFHPAIIRLMFSELKRIGKRIIWLRADMDASPFAEVDPVLANRLKEICRAPARSTPAPFDQEYAPSRHKRLVMEKIYWLRAMEVETIADETGLALEARSCPAPVCSC